MSDVRTSTPDGSPSRMPTSAGPCDSPAVNQRSMAASFHADLGRDAGSATWTATRGAPAGRATRARPDAPEPPTSEEGGGSGAEPAVRQADEPASGRRDGSVPGSGGFTVSSPSVPSSGATTVVSSST